MKRQRDDEKTTAELKEEESQKADKTRGRKKKQTNMHEKQKENQAPTHKHSNHGTPALCVCF
jgi:hypothetical protein